jgi:hypothetical protein
MSYIEIIVNSLTAVRQTGPDKWQAKCPAHPDKTPSLCIVDAGDKALVICRAGCTFSSIAQAMNLEPWQFFADGKAPRPIKGSTLLKRQLYEALDTELRILLIANSDRLAGRQISAEDAAREKLAKQRIAKAWRLTDGR